MFAGIEGGGSEAVFTAGEAALVSKGEGSEDTEFIHSTDIY